MNAYLTYPDCHRRGGVERIMVECANFLASRGHHVSVLSCAFDSSVLTAGIEQRKIEGKSSFRVLTLERYRRAAARELAGASGPRAHAAFGVASPPEGVLWVQSVHAEWLRIARGARSARGRIKQRLNPFHPYILRLEKKYYREKLYKKLIALTPRVRAELMEHYDVPAADIELLPNGYNPAEFNPARKSELRALARAERGYRDDDRVLVFVANELERKGFFPLAEAMAAMKDPSLKLLVVGRVSLAPHLPLLRRLGIEKQVYCHGPSADVARLYAAADLFVLPTYYEAWGLVIVEALATGLPVLTSRLAGAAVAVQEGETGELLDDPRDPAEIRTRLEKMLASDPISPESIAKTVERFRWSVVLQRYEEILAEQCA